ncbi:MAG: peptide ABC transporter substrate-binding protein [Desulfobacterales bacterium RIFOXYA12_FULL_46_15]|nr:MAG: peptide ABC transporter substrate-binding protein [Desulfobacterales bacterium RIFOXYA12_FULL_46_15]
MQSRCIIRCINIIGLVIFLILFLFSGLCPALTLIDHHQRRIDFDKPFKRIISLYGAHTENLFSLGLENQIIGVSHNDLFPLSADRKQKFSYHDDPEKFLAFSPDLVLIRPMIDNGYPELIKRLEKSGITVVSLQPSDIDEMYDYWLKLGLLTGKIEAAEKMIQEFKEKTGHILSLTRDLPLKKKVYFEAIHVKMKTFTKDAMPIFVLETAGGINIASDAVASRDTNIAVYGKEQLLSKASEIDVFLAQTGIMNSVTVQEIKTEPGFNIIKAIKENQIYLIDENIISRPVPRLYEGMVSVGKILYPDIFTEKKLNKEMQ